MTQISLREQKKQQTRHAFFDAVLNLCMTGQAFSSISLRQVTREVGVVPTAFYRHFSDMEDLGKCLVEEELGEALSTLRDKLQMGRVRSFDRQIAKSIQLFFASIDAHPRYWQFLVSERFGGSEAVSQAINVQIKLFSHIVGKDLGLQPAFEHIKEPDRYLLAQMGINLFFSWIIDWLSISHLHVIDPHDSIKESSENTKPSPSLTSNPANSAISLPYFNNKQDKPDLDTERQTMLHNCTRQAQMLFYGAENWKSSEETRL